ncbi:MAG: glycosyl hydrolase, glucoamylase [Flavipsychrobacter sp.]|jgi:GH15 family glucan-1,4-alpha-glucosidase|nr:glycosyl hydrolase, glucoamylase [Flavipsychrobacter sp.]
MQSHIYESGIIGNCAYLAHVQKDTNISWLCWPKFDSSFVFGGLLDKKKGGEFSILPEGEFTSTQRYIENTNVLTTEVECSDGKYRITDFAPRFQLYERYFRPLMMIRKIEPVVGYPRIKVTCRPVGEYGQLELAATQGSNHIEFTGLERSLRLTSNVSLNNILNGQHFVLNEPKYLVLTYGLPLEAPLLTTAEDFLMRTVSYWRHWIKNTGIGNMYQKQVIRSSLALKIHQYEDTGAIIAASTTSLPEFDGSGRTWDYRYCWLRDAYYILNAFNNIGHFEEGEQYFHFIANVAVKEDGRYNPLYKITGTADFVETIVDLDGYKGNKPVRIGNQAVEHVQNDTYGQVLLSLLPLYTDRRFIFEERHDSSKWISDILEKIERTIDEPDAGIWEFRHFTQEHCYTNLFQWAGCMAAMKMARHIGDERLLARAHSLREKAKEKIEACYDPQRKVYTQAIGTKNLDASTLQLIMMHYLNPKSQRARDHLAAVEAELKADHGLFYRYLHTDDFGKPKTTFLITAFWYVEALACVGRVKEAIEHFNSLMKFTNHLGLLSEDVDSSDGSQWGNFPQAYSHVGLMNAAYRISKKLDRPGFL